jgi:hypothetical protein
MLDTGQSNFGFHRLLSLIECPRKFGYREVLKLVPPILAKPLALGTAGHNALAYYYLGKNWQDAFINVPESWSYIVPVVIPIVKHYIQEVFHENLKILDVEREFELEIQGLKFTRRIDLIYKQGEKVFIMDHKFTTASKSRIFTNNEDPVLFTQALMGQKLFQKTYGLAFGGLVVNMIKPTKPYTLERHRTNFYPKMLEECEQDLSYWLALADQYSKSTIPVPLWPKSWQCQGRYSHCDYGVLCQHGFRHADQFKVAS